VIIFGLVLGFLTTHTTIGAGNEKRTIKAQGWSYTATIENGTLTNAEVDTNFNSAADVEAYASAMRRENLALFTHGVTKVTAAPIVFKRPLSWAEADAFVKKYHVYGGAYQYRLVNKTNPNDRYVWSIGMFMDGKDPAASSDQARQQLENVMKNELQDKAIFKGVIGMLLDLTASDYQQVSADPDVYLVEMPGEIIKAQLATGTVPELKDIKSVLLATGAVADLKDVKNIQQLRINKGSAQLYRQLEDFNLVSK
jgi:hypothetical protein